MNDATLQQLLEKIALDHLFVDTLQTRHSDRLDFHEVSVWGIQSALQAAFEAGQQSIASGAKNGAKNSAKSLKRKP
jgi:hypothetical protein